MAAVNKGSEAVATDKYTERCTAWNAKGDPCKAWAKRDGSGVCYWHSLSPDERSALAYRGGKAQGQRAREKAQLRDSGRNRHYVPGPTLQRALEVIAELLDSTIPGSTEPNYENRAWGVLAVAQLFRLRDRDAVLDLLGRIRPDVATDPYVHRVLDLEAARSKLVRAYEEGRISAAELPPGVLSL